MAAILTEALVILVLVLLNGLFATSEIAIVSSRRARLRQRAEAGSAGARAALRLAEDPNQFLSAVQIGITLVGILAGAFGGATLSRVLRDALARVPLLEPYSGSVALGLVVAGIAYLSLVLGELVPKRVGLANPERLAERLAIPMTLLSRITSPVVTVLSVSTEAVLRLVGHRGSQEPPVTEEEVRALIGEGTLAGVFEPRERELVDRVFRLADRSARSLMVPRGEIEWLDLDQPPDELLRRIRTSQFSRLPVGRGSLDRVRGILHVRDALLWDGPGFPDVAELAHPVVAVPEGLPAFRLLERLKQTRAEMALVVDEYGGVHGLVTARNVVEALVGELPDEGPVEDEPGVLRREDGSWLMDGLLPMAEVREVLGLREVPGKEGVDYHTLGGLVMTELGRVPAAGDAVTVSGYRMEVMDMDGRRVDKVLVTEVAARPGPRAE